jgi:hypothetical protein
VQVCSKVKRYAVRDQNAFRRRRVYQKERLF